MLARVLAMSLCVCVRVCVCCVRLSHTYIHRGAENAGVENAGVENTGAKTYGKPLEQKIQIRIKYRLNPSHI